MPAPTNPPQKWRFMLADEDGNQVLLGSCPSVSVELPIDYNVDENIFVVLLDDGTYTKGNYSDPNTDPSANRKCKVTLVAGTQEAGLIQRHFYYSPKAYIFFENLDVFLNNGAGEWHLVKGECSIEQRESTFDYKVSLDLELLG